MGWSVSPKSPTPVPNEAEEREIKFVSKFSETVDNLFKSINYHVNLGDTNCIKPILQHYGFTENDKGFKLAGFGFAQTIPTEVFSKVQKQISEVFSAYQQKLKKYEDLISRKPDRILFTDYLNGLKKEKETSNALLEKRQTSAIRPVFEIEVSIPFDNRRLKTNFDIRIQEFKKTQSVDTETLKNELKLYDEEIKKSFNKGSKNDSAIEDDPDLSLKKEKKKQIRI